MVWLLRGSLFLSVLALGLRATTRDALYLFRRPDALARTLLALNGIMAVFAVVVALSFDLRPVVKLALVALAVSPVAPIMPHKALRAGATVEYTIGMLVAAALASIVFIPLSMEVLERVFDMPLRMSARQIATLAVTSILLPLASGIALRKLVPRLERAAKPLGALAVLLLVVVPIPVVIAARHEFAALIGNGTILVFVAFSALALAVGHVLGSPEGDNRLVLALGSATRHPAVALGIAYTNFPAHGRSAAAAVILYLVVNFIVSGVYLKLYKPGMPRTQREIRGHA